ncbi:MAG: LysR family transcriptional regulator [Pseudomonadota bacterium]
MARSLPPLTWLRSFEASARHLNFTAAAQELGLTQSAISQQVRALELRLGVQLFVRKPRGLALTDDGRRFLPQVGAALDQLARAVSGFETGSQADLLTVAASVSVSRWLISPHLQDFLGAHPGLRLRLIGTIWPDEFSASLADVEIRFGSAQQVGKGADRLMPDDLVAVARPDRKASTVRIETVGTSNSWRDWTIRDGQAADIAPSVFVDSYGAALDLAVGGTGAALTSSLLAANALADGRLALISETRLPSQEGYFLAITSRSEAAAAFKDWLLAQVAKAGSQVMAG